jgi:hypothetical protein
MHACRDVHKRMGHAREHPPHTHTLRERERERERERREEREKCAASSCLKPNKQIIICKILRYSQHLIRAKLCEHKLIGQCTYHCLKFVRQCEKKIEFLQSDKKIEFLQSSLFC